MKIVFNKYVIVAIVILLLIEIVIKIVTSVKLRKYEATGNIVILHEDETQKNVIRIE